MLLFSEKGIELLERYGGHLAADVYRRRHDRKSAFSRMQMVREALIEMRPERFVQVMTISGDAMAVIDAFFIIATETPPIRGIDVLRPKEAWRNYRLRRYHDGYRYLLLHVILRTMDTAALSHARSNGSLFTRDEMTLLRGGLHLVKKAA